MPTFSLAGVGLAVFVLNSVLQLNLPEESIVSGYNGAVALVSLAVTIYGQWRRKDVTWFVFKNK